MNFLNKILWKIREVTVSIRRVVIILLISLLIAFVIYVIKIIRERSEVTVISAIIDADTGNGVSDLLAVSRAMADQRFEVIGLTSAQWNQHPESNGETVIISQNLNDTLLRLFKRKDIPHPMGGDKMLGYGNLSVFRPSEASRYIVQKAREATTNKKLNIITLGAMTNLASAILSDSAIVSKIRVYSLAMYFDPVTKVWNKNEFNARNDLDALDLVLNTDKLEIHIMPLSVSKALVLDEDELVDRLQNKGEPWDFIADRWPWKSAEKKDINIAEVALIEAILNPDFAREEQTNTPPENRSRQVFVYTSVNKEFMKIDFWKAVKKYFSESS